LALAAILFFVSKRKKGTTDTAPKETHKTEQVPKIKPQPEPTPAPEPEPIPEPEPAPEPEPEPIPEPQPEPEPVPEPEPIAVVPIIPVEKIKVLEEEEIRQYAYGLFEKRYGQNGDEAGDWYQSICELTAYYEAQGYRVMLYWEADKTSTDTA